MLRSRRRRSLGQPLRKVAKECLSGAAIEALESRCLFSAGAYGPEFHAPAPAALVANALVDLPAPHAELADVVLERVDLQPRDAAGFRAEFSITEVAAPAYVPDRAPSYVRDVETLGSRADATMGSRIGEMQDETLTLVVVTFIKPNYAPDFSDSGMYVERPLTNFAADAGALAGRSILNFMARYDNFTARYDMGDGGRPTPPPGLSPRTASLLPQNGEEAHHVASNPIWLGDAGRVREEVLGRRPNEALANAFGGVELSRPVANISPEDGEATELEALDRMHRADDQGPAAAVAFSSAASKFGKASAAAIEPSYAAVGSPSAWGPLSPLLPQFSPNVAQLGQAFDAVLADLDELGGDLFSSLANHDRLFWGLGAGGIAYYVAANHLHRRTAPAHPAAGRNRRAGRGLRRARLSVQPLVG